MEYRPAGITIHDIRTLCNALDATTDTIKAKATYEEIMSLCRKEIKTIKVLFTPSQPLMPGRQQGWRPVVSS